MANEEAVQPPIATDQSLISGLIRGGGVSRNYITVSACSLLFLPVGCLAAVTDSLAAPLLTVTTVGRANRGKATRGHKAPLTLTAISCLVKAPVCVCITNHQQWTENMTRH